VGRSAVPERRSLVRRPCEWSGASAVTRHPGGRFHTTVVAARALVVSWWGHWCGCILPSYHMTRSPWHHRHLVSQLVSQLVSTEQAEALLPRVVRTAHRALAVAVGRLHAAQTEAGGSGQTEQAAVMRANRLALRSRKVRWRGVAGGGWRWWGWWWWFLVFTSVHRLLTVSAAHARFLAVDSATRDSNHSRCRTLPAPPPPSSLPLSRHLCTHHTLTGT
jgi:hypothetical protein